MKGRSLPRIAPVADPLRRFSYLMTRAGALVSIMRGATG
jgi:hypothetical protein